MDINDLRAVNAMRAHQSNQDPMHPILEKIQDDLHIFYDDFCKQNQLDWLLSFQVRKLIDFLDKLSDF